MTQDVSRLLRLPGFMNTKASPVPCTLVSVVPNAVYEHSILDTWITAESPLQTQPKVRITRPLNAMSCQEQQKVAEVVRQLNCRASDRSRRDFRVVCELLRLKLSDDDIARLVVPHSKFATNGAEYLATTLANAHKVMNQE